MNPFAALKLPPSAGLTSEEVRAAWRTAAAATHPDREDGGDPERYSDAVAAYAKLRTQFGRMEALADLGAGYIPPPDIPPGPGPVTHAWRAVRVVLRRVRHGRPRRIAARAAAAAAVSFGAVLLVPGTPAVPAVAAAALTWLLLTSRGDLAPPPGK